MSSNLRVWKPTNKCTFDATSLGNLGEKHKITNHHITHAVAPMLGVTAETVNLQAIFTQ